MKGTLPYSLLCCHDKQHGPPVLWGISHLPASHPLKLTTFGLAPSARCGKRYSNHCGNWRTKLRCPAHRVLQQPANGSL
eukprot:scaffold35699_cov31-Tisochrysis_lutea.AAC.2